jgi:glutathione peroxidase
MKQVFRLSVLLLCMSFNSPKQTSTFYKLQATDIEGKIFPFSSLKGKKVMLVNTASECGYTPQYKDLELLYERYLKKNFTIIAFPSNDFGSQEPGNDVQIHAFCTINYGVTFPIMSKVSVSGNNMHPVFKWLTTKSENNVSDNEVSWTFNKYLIDENGNFVKHLSSKVTPFDKEITTWIESPAVTKH